MIPLKCIVEYAILQGQSYDLGKDFSNFQRTLDGTTESVKQKFEASINSQLNGKRIRARASRGYKQFEKDYEFDVSRVTIDDYYDNFVVVAHDESKSKPKEYFLKPGTKIQIIGPVSGHPALAHGDAAPQIPLQPKQQAQPASQSQVQPTSQNDQVPVPPHPMKEEKDAYEAYSIDEIEKDIKPWMTRLIKDPRLGIREFIKSLGWKKRSKNGNVITMYDIIIPKESIKTKIKQEHIHSILEKMSHPSRKNGQFIPVKFDDNDTSYKIRIKKITKHNTEKSSDTDNQEGK